MKKQIAKIIILSVLNFLPSGVFSQSIENIVAYYNYSSNSIQLRYDISDCDDETNFNIKFFYSNDGGNSFQSPYGGISGDLGSVKCGSKSITWKIPEDLTAPNFVFKIDANYKASEDCPKCSSIGKIIEEKFCNNCNGGKVKDYDKCFTCNGLGKIQCVRCKGTGKDPEYVLTEPCAACILYMMDGHKNYNPNCKACGGNGYVKTNKKATCKLCNGNGYSGYCNACNGTGNSPNYTWVVCPYCKGSTIYKYSVSCEKCKGSGVINKNHNFSGMSMPFIFKIQKPIITWIMPQSSSDSTNVNEYYVQACIDADINSLQSVELYVNDTLRANQKGQFVSQVGTECSFTFSQQITLSKELSKIYILAINNRGTTKSEIKYVKKYIKTDEYYPKRLALVIGNAAYNKGMPLKNPINDGNSVCASLKRLGFVVLGPKQNASYQSMVTSINDFGDKLKSYDVALFYYSGHGVQFNGTNYLIPTDAKLSYPDDAESQCIDMNRILTQMKGAGCKVNIIILDACRNNPFGLSLPSLGKTSPTLKNILIGYAAMPGQTASESTGSLSYYTQGILKYIENTNLTITEIFQNAGMEVQTKTGDKQIPNIESNINFRFYLKK